MDVTIVGVGARRGELTLDAIDALCAPKKLVLRTGRCEAAEYLRQQGREFDTMDALYDEAGDFDQLNALIVERLMRFAQQGPLTYAVIDLRDQSALMLAQALSFRVRLIAGATPEGALSIWAQGQCDTLAAGDYARYAPDAARGALIRELDNRALSCEVKLKLMERYPSEWEVYLLAPDGHREKVPLFDLDRLSEDHYSHLTSVFVPPVEDITRLERFGFDQLRAIVARLRAPGGCPWDIKQTHKSLAQNAVEEAYEVSDAIAADDTDALYDELGDLLLQVALHAQIADEHGEFTMDDVTSAICHKMIFRHEHVFGNARAEDSDEVLKLWEKKKREERHCDSIAVAMRAVTRALPALMRAEKVQKKAADVGFDWQDALSALEKVREETEELKSALKDGNVEEELGDLLFSVVNVARLARVKSEDALTRAINKFVDRFEKMEAALSVDKRDMEKMTLAEMDEYWDRVKIEENKGKSL